MYKNNQGQALKVCKASAGSGKTYTLVLEYLTIALSEQEGKRYKKILAVTFTNMAANEMKERIISELQSLAWGTFENQGYLDELRTRLDITTDEIQQRASRTMSGILHDYSDFSVMTIDKFVHKITRAFSRELDITPDFDIEMNTDEVKERISADLLEKAGQDKEVTQLLKQALLLRVENNRNWNLKSNLNDYAGMLFKEGMNQKIDQLPNYSVDDLIKCRDILQGQISKYENSLIQKVMLLHESLQKAGLDWNDFGSNLGKYLSGMINENLSTSKIAELPEKAYWSKALTGEFFKNSQKDEFGDRVDSYINEWTSLIHDINDWITGAVFQEYIDHKIMRDHIFVTGVMSEMKKVADQIKKDDNFLMISDFYRLITELILKEPVAYIYEKLGNRYEHFLIDEFQDTSVLQWLNFIPLLENSLAQGYTNFIVGDIKQSIYRFRNGEVEQFKALPKLYNPSHNTQIQDKEVSFINNEKSIQLNTNRRSSPEVVQFNNQFFRRLVSDQKEFIPLADYYENLEQEAYHEYPKGFVKWVQLNDPKQFDDLNEYEMKLIKENILLAKEKGYRYRDICVLNRKNKDGIRIANFLIQSGIPVISQESLEIKSHPSTKAVMYYLELILNPEKRPTLSLFLEHYFQLHPKRKELIPWNNMVFNKEDEPLVKTKKILQKLDLPSHFESFQSYSLYRLIEKIILLLDFHIDSNPYLQFLLHQTFEYSNQFNGNPDLFLEWFWEKGGKKSIKIPDTIDAVQITSIHKSKGLQYKVVLVPQCNLTNNKAPSIRDIKPTGMDGVPEMLVDIKKNGQWSDEYELEKLKVNLDNLNIYYVAFTRAQHWLIVFNHSKQMKTMTEQLQGEEKMDAEVSTIEWGKPTFFEPHVTDEFGQLKNAALSIFRDEEIPSFAHFTPDLGYEESVQMKIEEGRILHEILSTIVYKNQWENSVESYYLKGKIKDKSEWKQKISSFLNDDQLEEFYPENGEVILERGIIDGQGNRKIPDRVILNNGKTLVLDFKSGMPNNRHQKQVQEYLDLMVQLGYENVEGYLYYTGLHQLSRV